MKPEDVALQGLFKAFFLYDENTVDELGELTAGLDHRVIRWMAIHHPSNAVRVALFRLSGVQIGADTVVNLGVVVIDDYQPGLVRIGARVAIAPGVQLVAASNPNNSRLQQIPYVADHLSVQKPVVVGDDVWLGSNAILLPGVTVGDMSIVGAGSVVTGDVPPRCVVAGVPARVTRQLAIEDSPAPRE